ncbi:exo-beta-N-acetylmuramidase NamZ domain-containing protein [Mariniflexile ostreae]|uniref:Exo-beta-N-acetylmuramidase NamZ domain-containing protein n=1 Tax=Mariniflexile ostreae TaxID=1520892 RepID=A0ABV5FEZ5_9FLAO
MRFNVFKNTVLFSVLVMISCRSNSTEKDGRLPIHNQDAIKVSAPTPLPNKHNKKIIVGSNQTEHYLPLLKEKKIGIVANQTSVIFKNDGHYTHLVDSLLALQVNVTKVFAPEHGFRGTADAGEVIKDGIDTKTGLPLISLYGTNKKPSKEQLNDIDLLIFDIQDVGARFYTYISSLHYVMEACAENNIPVLILDRPNPNGHYIDGPVLESAHKSFVGMHPIPVVHGMTIGEYAQMINGEKWLTNGKPCAITVIPVKNYNRNVEYDLPIKPSPNLPNAKAINLYPSICLFEGTNINAGRGTNTQFQIYGSPFLNPNIYPFKFTPQSNEGAKHPKHENKVCYGEDLTTSKTLNALHLNWLIEAYKNTENKTEFFNSFFTKLAGTKKLQEQIEKGLTDIQIKATWQKDLDTFKKMRSPYLIYK